MRGRLAIAAEDPSPDKVTLEAPRRVKAGVVEMSLINRGDVLHDIQLFKVDGRHTGYDLVNDLLENADADKKPAWAHPAGGIGALRPGQQGKAVVALEPGRYLLADTQERPTGGPLKITNAYKGGFTTLEVTGEPGVDLPAAARGARIVATDRGFEAHGLVAGPDRPVRFENAGREWHQAVFFRVGDDESYEEAARELFARRGDTGWVPVDVPASRATAVLEGGASQLVDLSLKRGRYLIACFVYDRAGARPHFEPTLGRVKVR